MVPARPGRAVVRSDEHQLRRIRVRFARRGRIIDDVIETHAPAERAYLVALDRPRARFDADDSLDELGALVEATGAVVAGRVVQQRRAPDPKTWIGKGKAEELSREAARVNADLIVADEELTPTQQRSLEAVTSRRVVDRSAVILDIFARHARTREGRLQVEVAQYEYQLPRLKGIWKGLSRLGGGIGTRGPGESLLETDRRVIERRLLDLRARLSEVQQQRERSRQSRTREGLFLAALVGYTNVGKSTLMNALAGADVLVADQPFATLDPTTRRMALPRGGAILLSDTVGFVNKLPPTLVAAFRATLEELNDADLLVHVADAGHPNIHERIAVVRETLSSLGLSDRPSLIVFNKVDTLRGPEGASVREALEGEFPGAVFTSASTGGGLDALRARLAEAAARDFKRVRVVVPYSQGALVQRVRERGTLHNTAYSEAGIEIEADVPPDLARELNQPRSA
ncbi:MAG: GTPase HflX [Chloroflexi bacterium]|nr:MAG: GTPase HflX [Chloroflexota bacterium]TMC26993.1 MAG: GTPase HflX [Chloroflexota bacterium]TMC35740.1 MAG: GTPase HflX [Chloroflexota bacterium]TMC55218.1 MAG: GTPase HflX [Chloroflexota bacterium]TME39502.1 MAG: GTPase HflX [Chloroflexota bacterium]